MVLERAIVVLGQLLDAEHKGIGGGVLPCATFNKLATGTAEREHIELSPSFENISGQSTCE